MKVVQACTYSPRNEEALMDGRGPMPSKSI